MCIFVSFLCARANGYDGAFQTSRLPKLALRATKPRLVARIKLMTYVGSLIGSVLTLSHYQDVFKTSLTGEKVGVRDHLALRRVGELHPVFSG